MTTQRTTSQKAFEINMDPVIYGTIAEIGAGQEVSRNFFLAGGAAGTIAKSISAYDMNVSDALYGKDASGRYVTETRLRKMLDTEYEATIQHVSAHRKGETLYFAYANTVAARSYLRPSAECHGWMGICLQTRPGGPVSRVILHMRMLDKSNHEQQEAVGILGVNLIHAAFRNLHNPKKLVSSLLDNLSSRRMEVDVIRLEGEDFAGLDKRRMALYLLETRLTRAVMFSAQNDVIMPSEVFYKKNTLVHRSRFYPVTNVTVDMLKSGMESFIKAFGISGEDAGKTIVLPEISLAPMPVDGNIDMEHVLQRADTVSQLGYPLLVTTYLRFFRVREYLNRYTNGKIGFIVGVPSVEQIFNDDYYADLEGGIMGAFSKLFDGNTKLFIYPLSKDNNILTADTCPLPLRNKHLYLYLRENQMIEPVEGYDESVLHIWPEDILKKLQKGRGDWESMVPQAVAEEIISKQMFGFGSEN